jgi:Protein of unknown function (DUF4238)
MAGKKNHIIPKWMQKGFASRTVGEEVFTWIYRKGSNPFETNTGNSNAENYFYGRKEELNADDVMTEVETYKLSPLINKLRNRNCDLNNSKTEIAELIAHFSIRTKTMRKGIEQMAEKTFEGMKEVLTDDETVSNVLLNPSEQQLESFFDDALSDSDPEMENILNILKMSGFEKDQVKEFIVGITQATLKNEEAKNDIEGFVKDLFSTMFDGVLEDLPNSMKKAHNRSLLDNTIPQPRVDKYKQLNWSTYDTTSTLILGDVACIFRETGEKSFKASCEIDKTGQIYLPISSNQILIGTNDTDEIETDVNVLNEAIASCSYEQFICSENAKTDLIKMIGINAHLFNDDEVENELDEIRSNFQKMKDGQLKL